MFKIRVFFGNFNTVVLGRGFACVFFTLSKKFHSVKKILWLGCALFVCLLITLNKHAEYKWERISQFLIIGYYLEFTIGHSFLFSIGLAPFLWYVLGGCLIELAHYLHVKKYKDMRSTWKRIESLRERADLNALFKILLTRELMEQKYLGIQWKSLLENPSL